MAKRNFSDPIQGSYRRPLTFAERRVSIKSIKDNLNADTEDLRKKYSQISDEMMEKLLTQTQKAIENNDITAITELEAKYSKDIEKIVTETYKKNFDY